MKKSTLIPVSFMIAILALAGCSLEFETDDTGSGSSSSDTTTEPALPWEGSTVSTVTFNDWNKGSLGTSNAYSEWYSYPAYSSSTYYIHYFEDNTSDESTSVADTEIYVYDANGDYLVGSSHGGDFSSPSSSFTTSTGKVYINIVDEDDRKEGGDYYFQLTNSSDPDTQGTIDYNGGNSGSLSAGDIEVWEHTLGHTGWIEFQWEDSYGGFNADQSGSHTADIVVTGFQGAYDMLFYRNDTCSADDEETHYIYDGDTVYFIVEGWSSTQSGSFYLDLDSH